MDAKRFRNLMSGVADARHWANELLRRESRGPGDSESAMRRLEARFGIPWRVFWSMKYRPPTDVMVGVYLRLNAAYQAECERQERLLKHEREITQAKVTAFARLGRAGADTPRGQADLAGGQGGGVEP